MDLTSNDDRCLPFHLRGSWYLVGPTSWMHANHGDGVMKTFHCGLDFEKKKTISIKSQQSLIRVLTFIGSLSYIFLFFLKFNPTMSII